MASTGLITAEQLQTVVQAIMNKVLKVNVEDGIATAQFGDLTVTYNSGTNTLTFANGIGGTLAAGIPRSELNYQLASYRDEGLLPVPILEVGNLQNFGNFGGQKKMFCLPDAIPQYNAQATHPTKGGGVVLTTRYREYEPVIYSPSEGSSAVDVMARSYTYTLVYGTSTINITFNGNANSVTEYWVDIEFPSGITPALNFGNIPGGNKIVWTGEGEPDWSTLGGRRIQIHILAGMASYVISTEEGNSEYGGAIEE